MYHTAEVLAIRHTNYSCHYIMINKDLAILHSTFRHARMLLRHAMTCMDYMLRHAIYRDDMMCYGTCWHVTVQHESAVQIVHLPDIEQHHCVCCCLFVPLAFRVFVLRLCV